MHMSVREYRYVTDKNNSLTDLFYQGLNEFFKRFKTDSSYPKNKRLIGCYSIRRLLIFLKVFKRYQFLVLYFAFRPATTSLVIFNALSA